MLVMLVMLVMSGGSRCVDDVMFDDFDGQVAQVGCQGRGGELEYSFLYN